jgi:anti-sigma regulatory factor (Ser/Thr protein kinase)
MAEAHDPAFPDDPPTQRRRTIVLPGRAQAAGAARRFVGGVLAEWDLKAAIDDVAVCTSELVTNAYRHGVAARCGHGLTSGTIRLTLRQQHGRLWVDVRDAGGGEPAPRDRPAPEAGDEPGSLPEDGAGLRLVQAISDGWDWRPLPVGKVVSCWFWIAAAGGPR